MPRSKPDSTDDKALTRLSKYHPIPQLIRDYRAYNTLLTRYALPMPKFTNGDGRVHTTFRFTRTTTGRLSSTAPNLMAQPVRSDEGKKIRNGFVAAPGCTLLSSDLSQIEFRVCAHDSQDKELMGIFWRNEDIHAQTASRIFGIPVDQIDEMKHRYPSKRVGFGVLYGLGPEGLQEQLVLSGLSATEWTIDRCEELIRAWFDVYRGVRAYMSDVRAFAARNGYVADMWGRRRYVPGVFAADKVAREEAFRQAGNAPIQCLPGYTRVRTVDGYVPIEDFQEGIVWTGSEWAAAKQLKMGEGAIVRLYFDDGTVFDCDTHHHILVSRGAWPEWVNVLELAPGDVLTQGYTVDIGGVAEQTSEFWYWIGRYFGDGHLTKLKRRDVHPNTGRVMKDSRFHVSWAFGGDKISEADRLVAFLTAFGTTPRSEVQMKATHKGNSVVIKVMDYAFDKVMLRYGITPNETAATKTIPEIVFQLDAERKDSFIKGYYDADGTRVKKYKKGWVGNQITSVNVRLLRDTLLLLRSLGRRGHIHGPYRNKGMTHKPFYRLRTVTDVSTPRKIARVEELGFVLPVYTLSVDHEHHSFDSEGVVSRNSGAQGVIKQAMGDLVPLYRLYRSDGFTWNPLIQIHDDIVQEVQDEILRPAMILTKSVMESCVTLKVPVLTDLKAGKRWGELEKVKL